MPRRFSLLAIVSLTIVALDQVTKAYIAEHMYLHQSIPIIPDYFSLTYIRNPGAAFGILASSSSGFRMVFFLITSIFALGLLATIFWRLQPNDWWGQLTVASIFGGAIGNLIDRLQFGEVIDFWISMSMGITGQPSTLRIPLLALESALSSSSSRLRNDVRSRNPLNPPVS